MGLEEILETVGRMNRRQLGRLEAEVERRRWELEGRTGVGTRPPVSDVVEYRPHDDGYLQLEVRRYRRKDGSTKEHGPYWYFRHHEGGKQRTIYLGKTGDPETTLARERGERGSRR